MEQSFPIARPVRFGPLADRSFTLFIRQFPTIMRNSRSYFVAFWISQAIFLWLLPRLPAALPLPLAIWLAVGLCLPLWQWTLRSLHGSGPVQPLFLAALVPTNWLGALAFSNLTFALEAGEGLHWKSAIQRSQQILREYRTLVLGLLAAWLAFPWLLAELFKFLVQGCMPYIWGVFDVSLDIKAWSEPCIGAVQCLLASLVLPGFHFALQLFLQEYAGCREGGELLAALEQEYSP